MRLKLLFIGLSILSMVAAASYKVEPFTATPIVYANTTSRAFAAGDNGDTHGWNECAVAQRYKDEIGVICEGTRSIQVPAPRQLINVNYYCEFQFRPTAAAGTYRIRLAHCQ